MSTLIGKCPPWAFGMPFALRSLRPETSILNASVYLLPAAYRRRGGPHDRSGLRSGSQLRDDSKRRSRRGSRELARVTVPLLTSAEPAYDEKPSDQPGRRRTPP